MEEFYPKCCERRTKMRCGHDGWIRFEIRATIRFCVPGELSRSLGCQLGHDAGSNCGPLRGWSSAVVSRCCAPVELDLPRLIPIGISRAIDARQELGGEFHTFLGRQREGIGQDLGGRLGHVQV